MDDASANNSGSNTDPSNLLNENQSGFDDNEAEAALGFMAARVRLQRKLAGLGVGSDLEGEDDQASDTSVRPPLQPPLSPAQPFQQPSFQQPSFQTPPLAQEPDQLSTAQPATNPPTPDQATTSQLNRQRPRRPFPNSAVPGGISRSRAIEANNRASGTPAIAPPGTTTSPRPSVSPTREVQSPQRGKRSKLFFWKKAPSLASNGAPVDGSVAWPAGTLPGAGFPEGGIPADGFPAGGAFPVVSPPPPKLWQRQPYSAIAHTLAIVGTVTGAWFFGILVAQLLPGNVTQPPLQEALLRKSSRLARSLWHLPALWQTPTAQTRIEAIPLPETGPVLAPIALPPIERQPLIDELNAIETEIITLDRRLQGLEKKLGKPPYQGTDIDNRLNALRAAIDPLPRAPEARSSYTPTPRNPADALLDVAELKITLPSDALFTPGQDQLKEAALLKQVLDQLVNYPEATIVIRSYSDDQANNLESREYTLNQANALGNYLQAALPSTHRWVTVGAGLSQPIVSNDNEASRQQNRRIEILVDTR